MERSQTGQSAHKAFISCPCVSSQAATYLSNLSLDLEGPGAGAGVGDGPGEGGVGHGTSLLLGYYRRRVLDDHNRGVGSGGKRLEYHPVSVH